MSDLSEYKDRYEFIRLDRDQSGVLDVVLHTNGDSLRHSVKVFMELASLFRNIALDGKNRIIVITGMGREFIGPRANQTGGTMSTIAAGHTLDAKYWSQVGFGEGRELLSALLDIPVPVIAAVNGPVLRHAEWVMLSDLIIASTDASFEDSAHIKFQDLVPNAGLFLAALNCLGHQRARAFVLLGQPISAQEALNIGFVAEVLPKDRVFGRARDIAQELASKSDGTLRFTRALFTNPLKVMAVTYAHQAQVYEGMAYLAARET